MVQSVLDGLRPMFAPFNALSHVLSQGGRTTCGRTLIECKICRLVVSSVTEYIKLLPPVLCQPVGICRLNLVVPFHLRFTFFRRILMFSVNFIGSRRLLVVVIQVKIVVG